MRKTVNHRRVAVALVVTALLAPVVPMLSGTVMATEAGPGGANVGFDFSWNEAANPIGHTASFLETNGQRVNNCSPASSVLANTQTCNFVFDYDLDGTRSKTVTHAAQWIKWANATSYAGGKPVGAAGCSSGTPQSGPYGKAPLTLFDCFNESSFGQIIRPDRNGALTQFRMSMTCLVPSGVPRYEMYALLYQMSSDGMTIVNTSPLGATLVDLSRCPTASTWNGKTFSSSSFRMIPMTFGSPQLIAGNFYGIYLTGMGVPGTLPPGATEAMAAAKAASTTTTTTTTTTPWSSYRGQTNTAAPSNRGPVFTALGSTRPVRAALQIMTTAQNKTYYINSLTPTICLGSDRFMVFIKIGRCRAQIVVRRNGRIQKNVTTRVVNEEVVPTEDLVAIAAPSVFYFVNGTSRLTPESNRALNEIMPEARRARSLLVAGHTGNLSGENTNLVTLSRRRATAFRSLLRSRGARQTIAIWSFGGSNPVTKSKSKVKQAQNRRAELFIIP